MPQLNVRGSIYNYPDPGASPGWGPDATDWATAITEVIATVLSATDILKSTAPIGDGVASPTDINAFQLDGNAVRAANASYVITRGSETQSGTLYLNYNATAGWSLSEQRLNDVGVQFSILPTGQVQYISTTTGQTGTIVFSARTLGV